jgi:hypothetical protein
MAGAVKAAAGEMLTLHANGPQKNPRSFKK